MWAQYKIKINWAKSMEKVWLSFGFSLALLQGCSFFSTKSDSPELTENKPFSSTISSSKNQVPVPIDVATDVALASGLAHRSPNMMSDENEVAPRNLASEGASDSGLDKKSMTIKDGDDPASQEKLAKDGSSDKGPNDNNVSGKGKKISYQVQHGDTLMKISFEKYGNVYRWREIYNINKDTIKNYNVLVPGTMLTILGVEYIVIEKNGKPYLIKKNDTLVKISKWLYGDSREWKSLWENNRQLIHNPDKIYADFTLYYQPKEKK